MALRSPSRQTLVPQVIEQIRAQITAGEWPVGSRIPPEPQLAEALGVGRNTVREAVRALVHAGVLRCQQGSGTYVTADDELAGAVARQVTEARLAEAIEVRRALEVEAARLAALRRTPEDLAALDDAHATREAAWHDGRFADFVEADAALHTTVVAAAHNGTLAQLYASFGAALRASIADQMGGESGPARYVDHSRLLIAIRSRDPGAAAYEAGVFLERMH
jgi:DNA-binding FadR family transcriptional regulator